MVFTKDLSTLDIKTFSLHVFFAELNQKSFSFQTQSCISSFQVVTSWAKIKLNLQVLSDSLAHLLAQPNSLKVCSLSDGTCIQLTVQLKHCEWQLLLRASTQRSPASMGNPQAIHFVVNNSFQSEINRYDLCKVYIFSSASPSSQQGSPSSRQKGRFARILPQQAQLKHSGWKLVPRAFKQF